MLLNIINLHTYYDNIHALKGINLYIDEGEIVTLIGSNGAGKTTTLSTITGLIRAKEGKVVYFDSDITHNSTSEIVKRGICMAPEGREVFPQFTVLENLKIGSYINMDKIKIRENLEWVFELFPRLKERVKQLAGTLSGGEQQMLAIGRSLMSNPKLLLLDEPSLGLAPNIVEMIFGLIKDINKSGVTILLVEQNANMALQIADRGYVLENGEISLSDKAAELANNDAIRKAYLGMA